MIKNDNIPVIGKTYMFYDDGKITPTRQYKALVIDLISVNESKNVKFNTGWDDYLKTFVTYKKVNKVPDSSKTLYSIWQSEIKDSPWLYAKETDGFVKCSIPDYDSDFIWFVRTINGNGFSFNITDGGQSGKLDVTGELTKSFDNNLQIL